MTRKSALTQNEIQRCVKAALAAGVSIARIEIEGEKVIIITASGETVASPEDGELAQFRARHGYS